MKVNINNASDAVYGIFENYDWPGNIRELKNVIESAFNFSTTNTINVEDLPETVFESGFSWDIDNYNTNSKINLSDTIESFEKDIIISKSKYSRNLADLADNLGISKQNLNYKLKKYSLNL
jgi:arginine utilization regulatory protein